jgi:hypothetical protein
MMPRFLGSLKDTLATWLLGGKKNKIIFITKNDHFFSTLSYGLRKLYASAMIAIIRKRM